MSVCILISLILVKLGGSVITNKENYRSFSDDKCRKIIHYLAKMKDKLIVTHGAGSFGHILAKKSGFPKKFSRSDLHNLSTIHKDVLDLNSLVTGMMLEEGFNPFPISTQSIYSGRSQDFSSFKKYLSMGLTPIGMGDAIIKGNMVRIISADDLLIGLSAYFRPKLVIFITDVDGIYDKDPKFTKDAVLLRNIDRKIAFSDVQNDVTGGMKSKYEKILKIRDNADRVIILNGKRPERLLEIDKEGFIGTVI